MEATHKGKTAGRLAVEARINDRQRAADMMFEQLLEHAQGVASGAYDCEDGSITPHMGAVLMQDAVQLVKATEQLKAAWDMLGELERWEQTIPFLADSSER